MSEWTFLTNHALVLRHIAGSPMATAREIAEAVNITERTARKIIADLDADGYIDKKRDGRRTIYTVNQGLPLRHHTVRDVAVGDLLNLFNLKTPETSPAPEDRAVETT